MFVSIEKQAARAIFKALDKAGIPHWIDYERGWEPSGTTSKDSINKRITELFACDEGWIMTGTTNPAESADAFIYFIWGNGNGGRDCISDYSTSLESLLAQIIDALDTD